MLGPNLSLKRSPSGLTNPEISEEIPVMAPIVVIEADVLSAAVMSLLRSAQLNGHDQYAYMKNVLSRLPSQRQSEIGGLLLHRWVPVA